MGRCVVDQGGKVAKAIPEENDALVEKIVHESMSVNTKGWLELPRGEQLLLLATLLKTSDFGASDDDGWLLRPTTDILFELFGLSKGADQRSFKLTMQNSSLFETNGVPGTPSRHRVLLTDQLEEVLARYEELQKPKRRARKASTKKAVDKAPSPGAPATPAAPPNLAPTPAKVDAAREVVRLVEQIDPPAPNLAPQISGELHRAAGVHNHDALLVRLLADQLSDQVDGDPYILGLIGAELQKRATH